MLFVYYIAQAMGGLPAQSSKIADFGDSFKKRQEAHHLRGQICPHNCGDAREERDMPQQQNSGDRIVEGIAANITWSRLLKPSKIS